VDGQAVYDTAGLFSQETRDQAELIIDAIESQSKAEVVVYTQALGRDDITTEEAESHARALMDQWGVGRRGVDDGLVILFDLDTTNEHGQVQLYAGPGFSSSYLSDDERQAIYQDVMVRCSRTSSSMTRCWRRSARSWRRRSGPRAPAVVRRRRRPKTRGSHRARRSLIRRSTERSTTTPASSRQRRS
jgi:hypothetical protein